MLDEANAVHQPRIHVAGNAFQEKGSFDHQAQVGFDLNLRVPVADSSYVT